VVLERVFERFVEKPPVSVMFRGVLENALSEEVVGDVWIKDREFCTTWFVFGAAATTISPPPASWRALIPLERQNQNQVNNASYSERDG